MGPSLKLALQKANPDIRVIEPPDPWAAVVKGAVLSQLPLEEPITSCIATKCYGIIPPKAIYNELLDVGRHKIWDPYEHCFFVTKPVWFIKEGDVILPGMRIEIPCRQKLPSDFGPDSLILKQEIVECTAILDNNWPEKGTMRLNCTLTMDLKTVPFHELREFKDFIEYKLIVKNRSQTLDFSVEINGKEIGSVTSYEDGFIF